MQHGSTAGRLYVIGDIHGRLDLLDRMIAAIHRDVAAHGDAALTVTVGDYIDRGPDSCGVIGRLAANPFPTPYVALKGNHESMLEAFLADPSIGPHWRDQGGEETLMSYGVSSPFRALPDETAAQRLRAALPAAHADFLQSLRMSLDTGTYFLCHAGVRPGVPLDRQSDEDLLWIRDDFLESTMDFGRIVVHGHTPMEAPQVRPNRISIDTGAYATGRLTCVVLDGKSRRFIAT